MSAERLVPDPSLPSPNVPPAQKGADTPFDPLRLCIFATVALLGWVLGPVALVVFATMGFVGYLRARRAGLLTSRCLLGDTRLVLLYLGLLVVAGVAGTVWWVLRLVG